MNDPRKGPQWKQKRYEERVLLLLGAILDSVKPQEVIEDPNGDLPVVTEIKLVDAPRPRGRPRKVNA